MSAKLAFDEHSIEQWASSALASFSECEAPGGAEQRKRQNVRSDYLARGMVAWCRGETIPPVQNFKPVCYQDISHGGLAFRWPTHPRGKHVAVVLRNQSSAIVMLAKVVRVERDAQHRDWIVRCKFVRRIRVATTRQRGGD